MRLFVPLSTDEFDRLRALAHRERRRPQEQAAVLLVRSLDTLPAEPDPIRQNNNAIAGHGAEREAVPA